MLKYEKYLLLESSNWVKMYFGILTFPVIYTIHKLVTKSKVVPLLECDFSSHEGSMQESRLSKNSLNDFESAYIDYLHEKN